MRLPALLLLGVLLQTVRCDHATADPADEPSGGLCVQPSSIDSRDTAQRVAVDQRAAFSEPLTGWWGEGLALELVVEGRFEFDGSAYRWELESPSTARLQMLQTAVDALGLSEGEEVATLVGVVRLEYPDGRPHCAWSRSRSGALPKGLPGLEIVGPDGATVALFAFYEDDLIAPVSIVFLLDASGSMEGEPLRAAKAAVIAASQSLHSDSDVALIVHYTCDVIEVERAFGKADTEFRRLVEGVEAQGGTPLGDALAIAFEYLHEHSTNVPDRRVLIALTDGVESCGISPERAVAGWDPELARKQSFTMLGMSLTGGEENRLQKVADAAGGSYQSVTKDTVETLMKRSIQHRLTPRHGGPHED